MSTPMYLKMFEGTSSGSYMGRDDGYAETKYKSFSSIEALAKEFGQNKGEQYFTLVPVTKEALEVEVNEFLDIQREKAKAEKKLQIENHIKDLQKQLSQL